MPKQCVQGWAQGSGKLLLGILYRKTTAKKKAIKRLTCCISFELISLTWAQGKISASCVIWSPYFLYDYGGQSHLFATALFQIEKQQLSKDLNQSDWVYMEKWVHEKIVVYEQ